MTSNSKKNIFLDLDETLISSIETEDIDINKINKKFKYYIMEKSYVVIERPNLQDFLDYIFDNFNVSVWTAADKDYATFIIDKIILNKESRKLDLVLFKYHCNISKHQYGSSKSLRLIWENKNLKKYNENNTIIIDDYDDVWNYQRDNCIRAPQFEYLNKNSLDDDFLSSSSKLRKILEKFKKSENTEAIKDMVVKVEKDPEIENFFKDSNKSKKSSNKKVKKE
jgi:hypothetical protein